MRAKCQNIKNNTNYLDIPDDVNFSLKHLQSILMSLYIILVNDTFMSLCEYSIMIGR